MSSFEERKEGFERRFALDEELRFKATARRNRLLGEWAASKLGKTGDDAAAYAKSVVLADFEEVGEEDVYRKVKGDLDAAGVAVPEQEIRDVMERLLATAVTEVQAGV